RSGGIGSLSASRRLTTGAKEGAEQFAGAALVDAAIDFGAMVGGRLVEDPRTVLHCTALWVIGAEIEPAQMGEADRGGAHRARFEGDVEIAFGEVRGAEAHGAGAQYQYLGMCGRVAIGLDPIAGGGEQAALAVDEHGANRHLATRRR